MLHAVDAGSAAAMRTGMRVRVRWADSPAGHIRDIACFEPCGAPTAGTAPAARRDAGGGGRRGSGRSPGAGDHDDHADPAALRAHGVARGEPVPARAGRRASCSGSAARPAARSTSRLAGACPTDGVPTADEVELPDTGIVTTFCVVNVPYPGQRVAPPYVAAAVLLDGADIPFQHLILGCEPDEVRMGMRVRAVWKPRERVGHDLGEHRPLPALRRAGRAVRVLRPPPVTDGT